ncbi:MAG TPA: hypothetical protein VFM43_08840 [Gaiellaceae bacterium]|nr:hypothetical protein [Gaiellaceae bacterium]
MSSSQAIAKGGGAVGSSASATEVTAAASQRRFVGGFLGSFLAVLAAVLAFNVVVDPYALAGTKLVPTAVEPDRSIKLDLLQKLEHGPQILILGDSRGRQAEPSVVQRLTGHTAFNAAVTGGSAPEAYVFVRYTAHRFPRQKRRYIWFVSTGLTSSAVVPQLAQDSRARRYLSSVPRFGLADVKTYLSTDATKASWRVFEKCVLGPCRSHIHYHADGSLTNQSLHYLPEHAQSLHRAVAAAIAGVRRHPETLAEARRQLAEPGRFRYFDRILTFMNRRGEVPVIVINPVYPSVLAAEEQNGFPARRATLATLAQLKTRFRFVLVDCENSRTWGGNPRDWSNASHVNRANMRLELKYIVAHSHGALR